VKKLTSFLNELDFVEVVKEKKKNLYRLKNATKSKQATLFVENNPGK
jgi:hypothetical protein